MSITEILTSVLETISEYLWHEYVLFFILFVGILFTIWSGFCQWRALTHGVQVVRGKYDDKSDPGAINHFQALSAALSATVGIGNIGGVATAIAAGGPGAVFWMWVVGFIGMALKTVECTLAMLYRNTDDPENPHGGAMWVADRGFAKLMPNWLWLGKVIAIIFCVTLLISTITGGNMAQAFNVAEVTHKSFHVPRLASGIILALMCGMVIIGGIKVIGRVAGFLVPFMCVAYLVAGITALFMNISEIPGIFQLIFSSAFGQANAQGAFIGGTLGFAFSWGMKRAFFSNEAGQGSAPIAHSAAKTNEPVREGVVAGIGPFIDTLIVCTITALVILSSGAWNREAEAHVPVTANLGFSKIEEEKTEYWVIRPAKMEMPSRDTQPWDSSGEWRPGSEVFVKLRANTNIDTGQKYFVYMGKVIGDNDKFLVEWKDKLKVAQIGESPEFVKDDKGYPLFVRYPHAALTSHAFDRLVPSLRLGYWLIPIALWLFALSTAISWSYYGEQGVVYLFGMAPVFPYRILYCGFLVLATAPFINTADTMNLLMDLGTGTMLLANLPICLIFGRQTMRAYFDYMRRLRAGEFERRD